jgi:hypothetical protein
LDDRRSPVGWRTRMCAIKVNVEVQCASETLYLSHGPSAGGLVRESRLADQVRGNGAVNDGQHTAHGVGATLDSSVAALRGSLRVCACFPRSGTAGNPVLHSIASLYVSNSGNAGAELFRGEQCELRRGLSSSGGRRFRHVVCGCTAGGDRCQHPHGGQEGLPRGALDRRLSVRR